MRRLEQLFEAMLFRSRWLLAPFYIGLVAGLFVLLVHFLRELAHFTLRAGTLTEAEVILGVLALIDIVLVGNLILIVIFSGYENFVSKFDVEHRDRAQWMAKVDFSGLKMKLLSSIVAISAIQLLKAFMNVGSYDDKKLWWMAGIHVVFLGSMLIAAISDRVAEKTMPLEDGGYARRKGTIREASEPPAAR
jgi:uncharacterized protein (TIGR00645 family)